MKKINMIAALLAMLLPITQAWGTTYYYKLHLAVSSASTGSGKVYAATSNSDSGATYGSTSDAIPSLYENQNVNTGYAFAKADYGSVFKGWATDNGTLTTTSSNNPYNPTVKATGTSANKAAPTQNYYAVFGPNPDSYTLTLNNPAGLSSYTVTAPSGFTADLSHGGSATVYKGDQYTFKYNLSSDEYDFINWTVNGEVKETASVTVTISANTTITLTLKKKVTYYATCQGSVGGTYKANGTTVSASEYEVSNFGSVTVSLSDPVANSGYAFYGWYKLYSNGVKEYLSYYSSASTGEIKDNITIGAEFREVQDCSVSFAAPAEGKIAYAIAGGNSGEVDDADKSETVPAGADVTLTATSDYANRRAKWYTKNDSGEKVYFSIDSNLTRKFASSVVVGVDFIPVNEKIVNAIEAAQSSSSHEAILAADAEIVLGTSIEIPSGIKIDLDGHTLYVDGTLTVNGTLTGGTVSKCLKVIKQTGADGMVPLNPYGSAKYWKTEKPVASTASVSGTGWSGTPVTHLTVMRGDGVAVRGAITSSTKMVKCTFDGSVAVNHVTAIGAASDTADISENLSYILLDNGTINGPVVTEGSNGQYSRIRNSATIECADWTCTMGTKQISSSNSSKVLNASTFTYSSSYWQNGAATFYNCPSISVKNVKNTPPFYLYDSGSSKLEFSISSDGGTAKCFFYSGKFDTDLSGNGPSWINSDSKIYGGGFKVKPNKKWIEENKQSTHTFSQHSDGYWYLDINQDPNVASISGTKYLTIDEALSYLKDNSAATITLLKNVQLTEPYTLEAGKSLVIELNGCHIDAPNGFVKNYGSLSIRDNNNSLAVCGVTVGSGSNIIENYDNGTADICYGLYNGNFAVNGGTFTTHHGKFVGSIAKNGGTVNLKGGVFSSDVSSLMNEGYHAFAYGGWYYVGRFPKPEEGSSSIASFARVLTAMPAADKTLYLAKKTYSLTSCSSVDEWKRVAELKAAYVLYDDEFNFDILVGFDQDIAANTVQATVDSKLGPQSDYFPAMNAGVLERIFSPRITQNPISYKRFIYDNGEGNYDTLEAGVSDVNNANVGTVCVLAMDLWKFHDKTKTTKDSYLTLIALPYVFGAGNNVAMIESGTERVFKPTLVDALDSLPDGGGTVMLANDNTAPLKLEKAGTYTFDTMGFKHSGGVELGEGLSIKSETPVTSSVATLIPDAVATTYVVVAGSAATAVDAPTAVSGLVYDGTVKTGVAAGTGYTLSGNTATAAGSYTATATLEEGYVWSDDSSEAKEISWSIGKVSLTATAENKSVIRGETVPYTITYSGFVNGEDASALTAAPTVSCDYVPSDFSATATSYTISLSGGSAANYELAFVSGTLTVTPSEASIGQGGDATYVTSISEVVSAAEAGTAVSVTLVTSEPVTVDGMSAGKTLTVTPADGVTANVTVTPAEGAFIETSAVEGGTKYESKKITVEMATPQTTVEVKKIDHGTESAVTDATEINAAVTQLMGNNDVSRTDNTDKLVVLDKITVTPTKIVEEVVDSKTVIRSATFDVVPALNAGQSLAEGQKLKFRLPVDATATQLSAIVYHDGAQFGAFAVQTYNNEKFVEVESADFSPYGYDLLDGETANPVAAIGTTGYATFAEAIEVANAANVDEITILNGATESPDADWKVSDGKLVRKVYVAQIGTTKYETLAEAVAAVPTDGTATTITMIAGETIAADAGITIAAGKNIVLDLNGQTVQMAAASADERWLIKNEGTLTVKDSAENGKLLMSATGQASTAVHKSTIKNMGSLTVESGTIELTYSGTTKEEPTTIMNDASDRATSLTVKGGTVVNSANRGMGVYLAVNDTNATVLDVQGGRVEGYGAAVRYYFDDRNLTDAKLTFNMSNGTIHGRGMYGIHGMTTSSKDWNSISFDISGGTISCAGLLNRKSVIAPLQGTVSISGGTFAGDVYIYGHNLEITDGDFAGSVTLHRTKESLESASISGGQFKGALTIAETTNENTTNPYYNAKFVSGGIYGTAPAARNVVDGNVVVDNTDSSTQGDYPKTIGGAVASVVVDENTTYYATLADAIAAANEAGVDEITILNGATKSPDADWKVADGKLVRKTYVAKIGETKYYTLEDAFAAAVDGDTILMIADANLASTAVFSMASANASVVLDLNGKSVVRDGTKAIEAVKGILTIVDNSEDGSGSITAEGNTIYLNQGLYNGRVEIAGGLVCAKDYNAVRAYNGNAVIRGGTVKASQCAVARYDDDPGCDVEITGDAVVVATDGWTIQNRAGVPDNIRFAVTGGMIVNESEENPLCWYDVYGASFEITGGRFCSKVAANADPECRDEDIETGEVYETWYSFEDSIAEGYVKSPVAVEGYEWAYEVEKVIATLSHGTTSTSYASLDAAVAAAQAGDTVTILQSTDEALPYPTAENVTITSVEGVVLTGGSKGGYANVGFTLDGLTFREKGFAVNVSTTAGQTATVTIRNCTFDECLAVAHKQGAVAVTKSGSGISNVVFENNTITDVAGQTDNTVDARIDPNNPLSLGVYFVVSGDVTVTGNTISGVTETGINVSTPGAITIADNNISNWGSSGEGRAIRIAHSSGTAKVAVTGNIMQDAKSTENYVKITGVTDAEEMDVSGNYWGGLDPASDKTGGTGDPVYETDASGDVRDQLRNYYTALTASGALDANSYTEYVSVAQIGETKYYTLEDAFAAVPADGTATTITMIADETINSNAGVTIPAGKNVVLDLNGKTITGVVQTATTAQTILNKGTLVITDSSDEKNGKITNVVSDENAGSPMAKNWASNVIRNEGDLTVNAGNIINKGNGGACYAIDNYNSGKVTINGGTIDAAKASVVRMFYNNGGKVTVNDGMIGHNSNDSGSSYMGVQVQAGTNADVEITGGNIASQYAVYSAGTGDSSVNISGGTFDGYVGISGSISEDNISISGGTFNAWVGTWGSQEGFISGGNFSSEVPEGYCADGYIPTPKDPDTGYYTVKEGTYVAQIVRNDEVIAKYETFDAALTDALSGDTVQLLADVEGVTTTYNIDKAVTIDGQGQYKIVAGENPDPRGVVSAWDVSRVMFDMTHSTANVTFKDITLDNGEGHYYSFLARAKDGTNTFENAAILHGAEADASGADGVGYGAAVQVDGGTVLVKGDFYADTHGAPLAGGEQGDRANGIFPFTAFLYQTGVIHFDDDVNADIGQDLLLVGMVGAMEIVSDEDRQAVQEKLDAMNVPDGYYPYTLKVGDNSLTSFTGASPLGWNDIIDYGKEIMTTTSSLGMTMDPATTPVEVGLLADTVLPDEFTYEDSNFTINGNGNALSGTIKYTDNAGTMEHTVMGTQEKPLVLDMTGISGAIHLGTDIAAENVVVTVTEEQAAAMGKTIVTWDTTEETDEEAESMKAIAVTIVDENGMPVTDPATGEAKAASIIWDTELGIGYIGPCEARLTGPTHSSPIYTTLADAIARAAQTGDTVTLLMNIENFSGTLNIDKTDITLDGAGYSIKAAPVSEHRNFINAWAQANIMLKIKGGSVALKNITLDGDATHAYTYLVSADNSTCSLTTENITLLHGGEIAGDADGAALQDGAGYGAGIHLNNGAALTVKDGFYADTHGAPAEAGQTIDKAAGVFPFTAILPEGGSSVLFDLKDDSNEHPTVAIGEDLLLVGMVGVIPHDEVQGILDYMKVPSRFIPYTLTLSDGSAYAFTGASPLGWNDIIDYGKDIMDVSTAIGYQGLDKDTTPVEVGLLTDTALPETFTFADTNFTVNGNGHALSGTIKYTDTAGSVRNIALGSETAALVVDLSDVTNLPVSLGSGVDVANVVVNLTGEQASFGTAVFKWDAESEDGAPQHEQVVIKVAGNDSDKELVWDDEIGVAYIGPCEARLTGPGREPGYMDLTNAFDMAVGGDTVTLFWSNVTLNASLNLPAGTLLFATNKYELALGDDAALVFTNATTVFRSEMDLLDVIALAGDCANGYWLRHEADGTTNVYSVVERGEYIVTGNTEDGGVGTAVIKVSDEWIAANIGENVRTVNEIDAYLNSTNSTTNLREWEMYVLNQATPFRVTAVGKADNAVSTTLVAPASSETTGFTVAYSLDETLADGSVKTPGTRQASRDFAVPVASVTAHAFYRVRAHLTSGESTLVVDSANTIGVLKATASTAQTIVAVPWAAFGGGDVTVADLLRTDGLSADDELFVYNPSTQNFRAWTLGSGKTWEPTTVIAAGTNATPGDDASSVTVARGSGVLLKRGSVSAPLCFVGEVASGGKTALGAAQTSGSDGAQSWNLVASPSVEALDIANFPAPSSGGWDRIIVLTSGAPLNLTYKNGKWGYNKVEVKNGMAVPTRVTEGVFIPAGVGFWYLNSGAALEIEW